MAGLFPLQGKSNCGKGFPSSEEKGEKKWAKKRTTRKARRPRAPDGKGPDDDSNEERKKPRVVFRRGAGRPLVVFAAHVGEKRGQIGNWKTFSRGTFFATTIVKIRPECKGTQEGDIGEVEGRRKVPWGRPPENRGLMLKNTGLHIKQVRIWGGRRELIENGTASFCPLKMSH